MKVQYYNLETKELDDRAIIKALKEAQSAYKSGFILMCKEKLDDVSKAIEQYHAHFRGEQNETLA